MKTLISRSTVLVAVGIASLIVSTPARAQMDQRAPMEERDVVGAVMNFLDGIHMRDTSLMRSTVAPGATFVPVGGPMGLGAAAPIDGIIERTGKGTGPGNDERLEMPKVQIDQQLASVWAYFTLTRPGGTMIDACGFNEFLLRKGTDGWRIFQIAATSRTDGCKAIGKH